MTTKNFKKNGCWVCDCKTCEQHTGYCTCITGWIIPKRFNHCFDCGKRIKHGTENIKVTYLSIFRPEIWKNNNNELYSD